MRANIQLHNRSLKTHHFLKTVVFLLLILAFGCNSTEEMTPINPILPSEYDWSIQVSETTINLTDIHFINASTGWAVGTQVVLATANGGLTWPIPPFDLSTATPEQINSVFFINSMRGWMTGSVNNGETGEIFISQQSGAYPILQATFTHSLNSIFFLDEANGWAGGANGDIVSTIDGGSTWDHLANINSVVFDIQFTTIEKGWAVGANGALYQTSDGIIFEQENIDITARLEAVHFTDTLNGWACGNRNTIIKRHQPAQSKPIWSFVTISEVSALTEWNDIFFIDLLNGWVVNTAGKVYRTSDGGVSWIIETSAATDKFNAIYMISQTKGWIVGDNGLILTYTP